MMRFKLLAGFHVHGDKVYSPGDIIETETDLAARLGKSKFERLHDESKIIPGVEGTRPDDSLPGERIPQEKPQRRKQ